MLLVPRHLQRSGMTGDVPYYGGRFTPSQAYAASHPRTSATASAPPRAAGPVQVLVVRYEQPVFSGEVLAEIRRLEQAGLVALVDLLVVTRDAQGGFDSLPLPTDVHVAVPGAAEAILGASGGAMHRETDGDWSLDDVVPVGSTVAVALIEHTWAAGLRAAVLRSGGSPVDETWLAAEDLRQLDRLAAGRASAR
jgi:hypothetical protein